LILRALYDLAHTERLVDDPDYVQADVAYYLSLGEGGQNPRLVSVVTERNEGKKTFLDLLRMPIPREDGRTSGIRPLFLLDKASYVFGLEANKTSGSLEESNEEFASFTDQARGVLASLPATGLDVRALGALISFLDGPKATRHQTLLEAWEAAPTKKGKDLLMGKPIYIVFAPEGLTPLHRMPEIQKYWRARRAEQRTAGVVGRCLVTGRTDALTELHTKLKGVPGAVSSGVPLVSFNSKAFESYGLVGNGNAPIGQEAAEAYAAALNRLLDNKPTRPDGERLGRQNVMLSKDTVAVFWSRGSASLSWLTSLADSPDSVRAMLLTPHTGGRPPLEDPAAFFTMVLSGAQGRAIVRSFVPTMTAEVAANVNRYLDDAGIERPFGDGTGTYPLRELLGSLAPLGDLERLPPRLATDVYIAAITGQRMPRVVLESAVRRNRIEGTEGRSFAARCSLIRISLVRQRASKEEPTVSLDLENREPGYLLGRLLAVIDHVQQDALGGINATLVDRYYGSASSTPAIVFPTLLRRSQHHFSKLRRESPGLAVVREKSLQDAMSGLGAFPRRLTLEAQGLFALGFHHQRQFFFTKTKPGASAE
jgi:CRISPR-associated protein Csd1